MPEFNIEFDPDDFDPRKQDKPYGEPSDEDVDAGFELLKAVVHTVNQKRPDGMSALEVGGLIVQFMMQLRLYFDQDDMILIVEKLTKIAEKNVHKGEWINATTGKKAPPPILAEQVRDNPDGADMIDELKQGVSDEALRKLLDGEV